jgi:hypothetical protein
MVNAKTRRVACLPRLHLKLIVDMKVFPAILTGDNPSLASGNAFMFRT